MFYSWWRFPPYIERMKGESGRHNHLFIDCGTYNKGIGWLVHYSKDPVGYSRLFKMMTIHRFELPGKQKRYLFIWFFDSKPWIWPTGKDKPNKDRPRYLVSFIDRLIREYDATHS